ncbi:hypothetical protein K438DRAFT_1776833 [Mycena galopus ATCC 62051]|nr:hypothetical protein K438DRAFT_1776833 [Mycena galopus ATCC 62051]
MGSGTFLGRLRGFFKGGRASASSFASAAEIVAILLALAEVAAALLSLGDIVGGRRQGARERQTNKGRGLVGHNIVEINLLSVAVNLDPNNKSSPSITPAWSSAEMEMVFNGIEGGALYIALFQTSSALLYFSTPRHAQSQWVSVRGQAVAVLQRGKFSALQKFTVLEPSYGAVEEPKLGDCPLIGTRNITYKK